MDGVCCAGGWQPTDARHAAEEHSAPVRCAGQLAGAEWWEARGLAVPREPPETALTDVVRDLFAAMALPPSFGGGFRSDGPGPSAAAGGAVTQAV